MAEGDFYLDQEAQEFKDLINGLVTAASRITAAEGDIDDLQGDVASLNQSLTDLIDTVKPRLMLSSAITVPTTYGYTGVSLRCFAGNVYIIALSWGSSQPLQLGLVQTSATSGVYRAYAEGTGRPTGVLQLIFFATGSFDGYLLARGANNASDALTIYEIPYSGLKGTILSQ